MKVITIKNDRAAEDLWKWLLHEDVLFNARTTICVAAQSLLFAGAAITYNAAAHLRPFFVGLGLIVSVLWAVAAELQQGGTIRPLKNGLRAYGKEKPDSFFFHYDEIAQSRALLARGVGNIFGFVFPLVFAVAWIAFGIIGYWLPQSN